MDWNPTNTDTDGYICPPCPVFYPTAEEFQHPLKYISSSVVSSSLSGSGGSSDAQNWSPHDQTVETLMPTDASLSEAENAALDACASAS
ncbi:JmjN domain [Phytophthora cactorum]|nr:JmjN domain [Phytophthora cactorum]